MVRVVLLIASAICFGLAAFNVTIKDVQLGWAGACLFVIAALI